MIRNQDLNKSLFIANILKRSSEMKIRGFEKSILTGPENSFSSLCRTMKDTQEVELTMIKALIDFIKSIHPSKCKHPKKMQNTDPNGVQYCMKCGEDV